MNKFVFNYRSISDLNTESLIQTYRENKTEKTKREGSNSCVNQHVNSAIVAFIAINAIIAATE